MKKPKWLLSGLLTCGVCGGSYAMRGIDRYGCANRSAGTCANGRTVRQSHLEEGVLSGLKDRMLAPDVAEMAMKGFIEEVNKQNHARRANERAWQAELAKTQKAIGAIITAIEEGLYNEDMKARMADLQNRKSDLQMRLDHETVAELDKLPSLANVYREKVQRLTVALNNEEEREGAAEVLRGLIDRIVLTPGEADEMYATIHGEYGNVLNWLADQCRQTKTPLAFASGVCVVVSDRLPVTTPEGVVKLVAGARFELTTFRL
ncbi:zinc ribbon domain-containing protein [Asticcacaulis benevestitus]|nr:zinc ribbon domain-containing protein [Asticcacaulis benevestitus]